MTSLLSTQLDSLLSSTNVKGFPIVSSDGALTLVGYIDRSEIRHVLGELYAVFPIEINHWIIQSERARKNRGRLANIPCLFNARHQDHDGVDFAPSSHDDDEQEEFFAPTTAGECIQFWPWVNKVSNKHSFALVDTYVRNKTPMTVSPDLPLEIVMQIFKRLG